MSSHDTFPMEGPLSEGSFFRFLTTAERSSLYAIVDVVTAEGRQSFALANGRLILPGVTDEPTRQDSIARMTSVLAKLAAATSGSYRCGPLVNVVDADRWPSSPIAVLIGSDRRSPGSGRVGQTSVTGAGDNVPDAAGSTRPTPENARPAAPTASAPTTEAAPVGVSGPGEVRPVDERVAADHIRTEEITPTLPTPVAETAAGLPVRPAREVSVEPTLAPQPTPIDPVLDPMAAAASTALIGSISTSNSSRPMRASQLRSLLNAPKKSTEDTPPPPEPEEPTRQSALRSLIRNLATGKD